MGGTISLQSTKNVGTCFTFSITAEIPDASAAPGAGDHPGSAASRAVTLPEGLNMLVVEDSSTLRRLWSKLLTEQRCVVESSPNGMDAVEKCLKKTYDVVLMDITMPVMSGDVAVSKMRENGYSGIVIALTANAMDEDKQLYLNVGMDAVVTKPFKMNELRMVITDLLAKRRGALKK